MIEQPTSQNKDDMMRDYEKFIKLAEDKTVITLLEKLVTNELLEFITEYPSVVYTKEMVKLMTYITQYCQTYNIYPDKDGKYDTQDTMVISEMCRQFMLKMTSHKRRRAQEIVNGASRQESGTQIIAEHKGLKRFLGIK